MGLAESLEELETLDVPRGVVYAANKYGQAKINLAKRITETPAGLQHEMLAQAQKEMGDLFDAFVAGAQWAHSPSLATLRWMAQTVHQAHHEGAIETCGKNTCMAARDTIAKAEFA